MDESGLNDMVMACDEIADDQHELHHSTDLTSTEIAAIRLFNAHPLDPQNSLKTLMNKIC